MKRQSAFARKRNMYAFCGSMVLTGMALYFVSVATLSSVQKEDQILASFERDMNRTATVVSRGTRPQETDPLQTYVNVPLWNQADDQVLASFERELNHEPVAVMSPAARTPEEDPLYLYVNVPLREQGSGDPTPDSMLAGLED